MVWREKWRGNAKTIFFHPLCLAKKVQTLCPPPQPPHSPPRALLLAPCPNPKSVKGIACSTSSHAPFPNTSWAPLPPHNLPSFFFKSTKRERWVGSRGSFAFIVQDQLRATYSKDHVFQNGLCIQSRELFLSQKTADLPECHIHLLVVFTQVGRGGSLAHLYLKGNLFLSP